MQDFAKRIGDLLAPVAETLQPAEFEERKKSGFRDDGPAGGRSAVPAVGTGRAAAQRLGEVAARKAVADGKEVPGARVR